MIGRLSATFVMLLLAFLAFWSDALNAGYFPPITGFLFLFLAVIIWFKWGTIGRIFNATRRETIRSSRQPPKSSAEWDSGGPIRPRTTRHRPADSGWACRI